MKKSIIFVVFILLLSSLVFAAEDTNKAITKYLDNLPQLKNDLNANLDKLPGFARSLIGNDKINLHFTRESGDVLEIYAELKGGKIEILDKGSLDKADIDIYANEKDINDITSSDNAKKTVKEKLNSDAISYKAKGLFRKMKLKLVKTFL